MRPEIEVFANEMERIMSKHDAKKGDYSMFDASKRMKDLAEWLPKWVGDV